MGNFICSPTVDPTWYVNTTRPVIVKVFQNYIRCIRREKHIFWWNPDVFLILIYIYGPFKVVNVTMQSRSYRFLPLCLAIYSNSIVILCSCGLIYT